MIISERDRFVEAAKKNISTDRYLVSGVFFFILRYIEIESACLTQQATSLTKKKTHDNHFIENRQHDGPVFRIHATTFTS